MWAKIIEQELSLSVVACLPSNNECVMHDAKSGGGRIVSVTMTLIFFKIVWMCPLITVPHLVAIGCSFFELLHVAPPHSEENCLGKRLGG